MRVIEKIEVSKLKYGCVVVTQNFLFNYSLFKIILNPSKKVEFSSENQKDMSVDGSGDTKWTGQVVDHVFITSRAAGARSRSAAMAFRVFLKFSKPFHPIFPTFFSK